MGQSRVEGIERGQNMVEGMSHGIGQDMAGQGSVEQHRGKCFRQCRTRRTAGQCKRNDGLWDRVDGMTGKGAWCCDG